jgi:hypothetical protein
MLVTVVIQLEERVANACMQTAKYIKGFKPEELKISLWEGEVTMQNVELNTQVAVNDVPSDFHCSFARTWPSPRIDAFKLRTRRFRRSIYL